MGTPTLCDINDSLTYCATIEDQTSVATTKTNVGKKLPNVFYNSWESKVSVTVTITFFYIYPNDSNIARANYFFLRPQVRELFEILKCANLIEGANYY